VYEWACVLCGAVAPVKAGDQGKYMLVTEDDGEPRPVRRALCACGGWMVFREKGEEKGDEPA
jgi:hypothetical protein